MKTELDWRSKKKIEDAKNKIRWEFKGNSPSKRKNYIDDIEDNELVSEMQNEKPQKLSDIIEAEGLT